MDSKVLIAAIDKAIQDGAVAAPPVDLRPSDENYVRTQTEVGITPAAFEAYVAALRVDPDMAAFDNTFANSAFGFGGGVSVGLPNMARLLLAQAIATQDVAGTVERLISFRAANSAAATAVVAVSGIKTSEPIKLGHDVSLIPITALPRSTQRGIALRQDRGGFFGPRFPVTCAFTTQFKFEPVFYEPKTPQPPTEIAAHLLVRKAQTLLEEALDLLGVLGVYPQFQMSWVQPDDWLAGVAMNAGWQIAPSTHLAGEAEVPKQEAEGLAAAYFALDPTKRAQVLRIPLDRLGRAGRERDIADRAIDLGIALEALLLHDLEPDRGELGFRLSLRGAWLIGATDIERSDVQKSLRAIYKLRSDAVHSGFVASDPKTTGTIVRATELCGALIRRIIELKCKVEWQGLVLGIEPAPPI
jgi:hypothetical protein